MYGEDTPSTLPAGEWLKVRYVNESARIHPMHMHGVFFRVLSRNGDANVEPYWRDTIMLFRQQEKTVAFVADNPGKWMLHCHMLSHQAGGHENLGRGFVTALRLTGWLDVPS